jgi:hypothetical protein
MPPRLVYVRTTPTQLPPTGFPTEEVAGGAVLMGSIGWFILRRLHA